MYTTIRLWHDDQRAKEQQELLIREKKVDGATDIVHNATSESLENESKEPAKILPEYISLYEQNNDMIGWFKN